MKIEFLATIPPIQSALKFGGDAARVTFEVPKSEVEKAVGLIPLQDVVLKVTVEVDEGACKTGDNRSNETNQLEARPKRKSTRTSAEKSRTD